VTHGELLDKPPEGCRLCLDAAQSWVLALPAGPDLPTARNQQHSRGQAPESSMDLPRTGLGILYFFKGKLNEVADDDGRKGI
jgi:hypothetical protein